MINLDEFGRSALHYASLKDDLLEAKKLIEEGYDLNLMDKQGFTPLHLAAQEFSLDIAKTLLESGAMVDVTNKFGNTPLFVAVFNSRGRGEMIRLLKSYGADSEKVNNHGQTPRGLAHLIGNYAVAQFFPE